MVVLASGTELKVGPDVFSRPEGEDRVYVQRSGGADGPRVRLIREPGRSWWSRLESGVQYGQLLDDSSSGEPQRARLLGFIQTLVREGFVVASHQGSAVEAPAGSGADDLSGLFEDPYAYQFSQSSLWSPWYVLWEVTDRCSEHCSFCYNPERVGRQVGLGESEGVISEIARMRVPFVTLLGGEPLSNIHVYEIIRQLHSRRIWTKLITSGVPLTPANVRRLKEAGLDQIALSLDGLTPETNDLTRGPGAFEHFVAARRALAREIPMISVSLSISTLSLPQLDQLAEFSREWDIDETYLSALRAVDGIKYPPDVAPLSRAQIAEMHLKAEQVNRQGAKVVSLTQCSCGRSSAVIQADGLLRPCPFETKHSPDSIDVSRGDFAHSWSRIARKAEAIGKVQTHADCFHSFEASPEAAGRPLVTLRAART